MTWNDSFDIGIELYDANPDINPLDLRFTDLHKMVISLPDFDDNPDSSGESKLEAIQMAWYEEYTDNQ